jgi:hypothetical protein
MVRARAHGCEARFIQAGQGLMEDQKTKTYVRLECEMFNNRNLTVRQKLKFSLHSIKQGTMFNSVLFLPQ